MKEFFKRHKNTVFRYWQRKRMWTPYDQECKDPYDQECKDPYQLEFGDDECSYGYIVEVVDLGYDWLIGISPDSEANYIEYYKLNDIELAYAANDQEE